MRKRIIHILFIIIALPSVMRGQNIFTAFQNDLKKADRLWNDKSYSAALDLYRNLAETTQNEYSYLKTAQCLKALHRLPEAEQWYEKVMGKDQFKEPADLLDYAESLMTNGKYQQAQQIFSLYLERHGVHGQVEKKVKALSDLRSFYEDSLSYSIQQTSFNSPYADFSPAFYKDGIVFVSSRPKVEVVKSIDPATNTSFFDLYFTKFQNDSFSAPVIFDDISTKYHDGPVSFFARGTKAIFTSNNHKSDKSNDSKNDLQHLMLYMGEKDSSGRFNQVQPLPFNNSEYSVSHSTFSEVTNTLYFSSDMPGGFGGTDIYSSKLINGKWTDPENLGPDINTYGNEMFPFIFEGTVLCFASNGHPGLGGLDNYYILLNQDQPQEVKNVGYPVNTSADDFALIIQKDGSQGYFSSNRNKQDDIFHFSLNQVLFQGTVVDMLGEKKMKQVHLKLFENGQIINEKTADDDGHFSFSLKPGKTYVINAFKEGYRENNITISTPSGPSKFIKVEKNILLERRNKSFVKAIVRDTLGNVIAECPVKILNEHGQSLRRVTDAQGVIKCEVDSDVENLFIADKERLWGSYTLMPESRSKGSLVLNVDLEVIPVRTYDINGFLKSETTQKPLQGFEVQVINLITNEKNIICTGEDGRFNFKAVSNTTYDVIIQFGKKRTQLKSFAPKQDYNFEIFWSEKFSKEDDSQ